MAIAALAGFAAIFVWYANRYFLQVWGRGTRSITSLALPLWVPMLAWYVGWIVFLVVSVYLTVVSAWAYYRGELAAVQARVGPISEEEEAELEIDPDAKLAAGLRRRILSDAHRGHRRHAGVAFPEPASGGGFDVSRVFPRRLL